MPATDEGKPDSGADERGETPRQVEPQEHGIGESSEPIEPEPESDDDESDDDDKKNISKNIPELTPDHYLTHMPKHPHCEACQAAKMQRRQCRRVKDPEDHSIKAVSFGDLITADHVVTIDPEASSVDGDSYAVVMLDVATGWLGCYPTASKSGEDATRALQDFVGSGDKVGSFYSDNAEELVKAAENMGWRHHTSTPGRPQTNGRAERTVRTVLEGTRTLLEQSKMPSKWWSRAARTFCLFYNSTKITASEQRHGKIVLVTPVLFLISRLVAW